jgi:hypothetical protein
LGFSAWHFGHSIVLCPKSILTEKCRELAELWKYSTLRQNLRRERRGDKQLEATEVILPESGRIEYTLGRLTEFVKNSEALGCPFSLFSEALG